MTTHPSFTIFTPQSKAFKSSTVFFPNPSTKEQLAYGLEPHNRPARHEHRLLRQEVR